MIIGTLVGLAGGYLSGRHLPPVLRVLPAGLLLLDGHALFMLAHAHGGYFFGPFLLYIACAFAGMSKRKTVSAGHIVLVVAQPGYGGACGGMGRTFHPLCPGRVLPSPRRTAHRLRIRRVGWAAPSLFYKSACRRAVISARAV
jgi:hypothetical protein